MAPGQAQPQKQPSAAQLGKIDEFFIPADEEDWHALVSRKSGLRNQTIHTIPADWLASASEASNSQYVMLRSYSPRAMPINSFTEECAQFGFTTQDLDTAAATLSASPEWCRYLQIIESGDSVDDILATSDRWPGSFAPTRRLQEQTMTVDGVPDKDRIPHTAEEARVGGAIGRARPQRIPELPDTEDEATTNAAAIILLQTVSQFAHSKLEWVMNRVHFRCQFKHSKFNTFTDGALRSKNTMDIFAIVEVKKTLRRVDKSSIFVQEACELAGWLMHSSEEMAHFNGQ